MRFNTPGPPEPGPSVTAGPRQTSPRIAWELPASPAAAAQARSRIRATLAAWGLAACAEDTALLASELIANAAVHGSGPVEVTLQMRQSGTATALVCEVTDQSPRMPRRRAAGPNALNGRGLAIVSALASACGVRPTGAGKSAWFEIALPPGTPQAGIPAPAARWEAGQSARAGWKPNPGAGLRLGLEQAGEADGSQRTVMGYEAEIG